ncbi:MAG: DNA primase [Dehalococcoidia bacterium]|nr:DNA primase [Dehalococcoidia bacterium]
MSTIDDIKARLDIVETVGGYVPDLKKAGRTWKARCPFHNERTPSFVVDPERGTWHCFGSCSTGGDVLEFVRRVEGLDFKEALRRCAERAGIELRAPTQREVEEREQHERLLQANEGAAVYFQAALAGGEGADARAYLERRGVDAETASTWQLGYAPEGWRGLVDHLTARGFTEQDLIEAGLAIEGDRGAYDRFRHRLILPTRDQRRRLIGFGARALRAEDEPKYLNTPQTPLFDKSGNLYGLDRATEHIRRADQGIIVEGYMDVIAAHQFGVANVVASNGTSITEKQMALLKRFTQNVVLALDADNAGSEATLRGVEVASGAADRMTVATVDWRGLVSYQDVLQADIRVVALPEGDDPDSLVRRDPEQFRALVAGALPVADHLFEAVSAKTDPADARARSRALQALAPTVEAMRDPVVQSHYVQKLARLAQVDERTVIQSLAPVLARTGKAGPRPVPATAETARARRRPNQPPDGETQLLQLLLQRSECRGAGIEIAPETFEDSTHRAIYEAWRQRADLDDSVEELDDLLQERYRELRTATIPDYDPRHLGDMVRDMAQRLRLQRAQRRLSAVAREQAEALRSARLGAGRAEAGVEADGAVATEVAEPEGDELPGEFGETIRRQRELTLQYQVAIGRRPASAGGDDVREETR